MSYVLIIGAKSDIAKAVAIEYARNGYDLFLAARGGEELSLFANDITIRFERNVKIVELNVLNYSTHDNFYEQLDEKPEGVICLVGYLGDQCLAQSSFKEAKLIFDTNYMGVVSLLNIIANDFEKRNSGFIVGISSVAGDRGRKSNYMYGSAKSAFTTYLSGLRNRLSSTSVTVLTVKPGFVNTKMTENMDLPKKLTAEPKDVARDIYVAQTKKKNVIYSKSIWFLVMLVIRNIPEFIFKKTSI